MMSEQYKNRNVNDINQILIVNKKDYGFPVHYIPPGVGKL